MKTFKTTGACVPSKNYMVDLSSRLAQIKIMVDNGAYFTINRARQYGKTTTLTALRSFLSADYDVISLDFQGISSGGFESEGSFTRAFARMLLDAQEFRKQPVPDSVVTELKEIKDNDFPSMDELFRLFTRWCIDASKPVVLIIDEVDSATNNQVFLDFLAQLRLLYLQRESNEDFRTFQSVILAGVTDVKNLKRKLRPDEAHKFNSPWNIAADFNVDMSFNQSDIAGMLREYEADHGTGMDVEAIAQTIEDYTSGYPFLVSRICQLLDEDNSLCWDQDGVIEIVRRIVSTRNLLFDSLMGKVHDNERLRDILWKILFTGETVSYNAYDVGISDAEMYGFVCNNHGTVAVTNRIFEMLLYNFFLSQAELNSPTYRAGAAGKFEFIKDGHLDMELILERYVAVHDDLYKYQDKIYYEEDIKAFPEAEGRLRFLLFIRPIINGTGNYYVETQTLDGRRMDLVIDYKGERYVIELKIWRGNAYNERGEEQLKGYLDDFHLSKGYMLSYNFNKKKNIGVKHIWLDDRELVEAVV